MGGLYPDGLPVTRKKASLRFWFSTERDGIADRPHRLFQGSPVGTGNPRYADPHRSSQSLSHAHGHGLRHSLVNHSISFEQYLIHTENPDLHLVGICNHPTKEIAG